jgi:hypothetical protein
VLQFARSVYYDRSDPGHNAGVLSRELYRDVGYFCAEMRTLCRSLNDVPLNAQDESRKVMK